MGEQIKSSLLHKAYKSAFYFNMVQLQNLLGVITP